MLILVFDYVSKHQNIEYKRAPASKNIVSIVANEAIVLGSLL